MLQLFCSCGTCNVTSHIECFVLLHFSAAAAAATTTTTTTTAAVTMFQMCFIILGTS
jgi:hypothetical protein